MPSRTPSFATRVVAWQRRHGRHDLPWQGTRDPYRIWVAEIMLQQTQVAAVIGYFERFVKRFPTVASLAAAPSEEVMRHWSGLGYYARARNLQRAAQLVVTQHAGRLPLSREEIEALPGIGRSTAAAILAFATGEPHAILDGNVKRVLARHFGIPGAIDSATTLAQLWSLAQSLLPSKGIERYTQGLMDLGATVCTRSRPGCPCCPLRPSCVALGEGRLAELPGRKTRRPVPARAVAMVVAVSRGDVLLEKRPPSGIWGGLWSLPEAPPGADLADWIPATLGLDLGGLERLEPFTHAFTHFSLAVVPWLATVKRPRQVAGEATVAWLPLHEAAGAALPAPVKKLLVRIASETGSRGAATRARGRGGER